MRERGEGVGMRHKREGRVAFFVYTFESIGQSKGNKKRESAKPRRMWTRQKAYPACCFGVRWEVLYLLSSADG